MMQRIQKVIPMPYNEEKLMNLMENDFPEVKESIEDFFESDYYKKSNLFGCVLFCIERYFIKKEHILV